MIIMTTHPLHLQSGLTGLLTIMATHLHDDADDDDECDDDEKDDDDGDDEHSLSSACPS